MTYRLAVKAEAVLDMTEAFEWYESQRIGLGSEFLDEVDEFFNRIIQYPEHFQLHKNQRIAVMHRFPYKIVFEVEQSKIVVYAVYHDKRDPIGIRKRE